MESRISTRVLQDKNNILQLLSTKSKVEHLYQIICQYDANNNNQAVSH